MQFTLLFNIQLKSAKSRGFTCMTFGKHPYYIEHVPEQMPFLLQQQCLPTIIFLHHRVASFGFRFIFEFDLQSHFHFFMTWYHLIIQKENSNRDKIIYFVLNHIILMRKSFFTSAYFSPFDLKSLLNQKLSSLKAKFCFCD